MVNIKRIALLIVVGIAIILNPSSASAHRPIFAGQENIGPDEAVAIPDPNISWAIYAELASGEVHFYSFTVKEELDFFAQMTIPALAAEQDFAPSFVLIGENMNSAVNGDLPFHIPEKMGGIIVNSEPVQETFFEPFTQTRYWIRQEYRAPIEPGDYYLAVYNQAIGGRYTLAVGEEEVWTWRDILSFPLIWLRVRWWYSPSQTMLILAGILLLMGLILWRIRCKL